ncbi:hypothetical protein Tco_0324256 [Tanacetum coccineum]
MDRVLKSVGDAKDLGTWRRIVELGFKGSANLMEARGRAYVVVENPQQNPNVVTGASPVVRSPYRLAPSEMLELSNQLKELTRKGFYSTKYSPMGAPCYLYRLVRWEGVLTSGDKQVDYKEPLPSPRLMHLFYQLQGACCFSKLDLFAQDISVEIREEEYTEDRV